MKYVMAKYTVKQEKLKEVKRAIAEVVAEIRRHEPRTFYAVFREERQPTFLHLMSFENEAAERKHAQSRYIDRFVKRLYPHCAGKPVFVELKLAGSSRRQWSLETKG
jgi:quinol monooxygenase YgiN